MFNIEKSINDWREQMRSAGIKTTVPLEELELHLREDIDRLKQTGLSDETAFDISVKLLGQPQALKTEFKKNGIRSNIKFAIFALIACPVIITRVLYVHYHTGSVWKGDQIGWLVFAAIISIWAALGMLFNLGMGQVREVRIWKLAAIIYSSISVWAITISVFQIFLHPQVSAAIGVAYHLLTLIAVAASFLSVFAWQYCWKILPVVHSHLLRGFIGVAACVAGSGLVSLFFWNNDALGSLPFPLVYMLLVWAQAVMAILAGVGYGLSETVRRQTTTIAS